MAATFIRKEFGIEDLILMLQSERNNWSLKDHTTGQCQVHEFGWKAHSKAIQRWVVIVWTFYVINFGRS